MENKPESNKGESKLPHLIADASVWAYCLDLAEAVYEEKLSRQTMLRLVSEKCPELDQAAVAKIVQEALGKI